MEVLINLREVGVPSRNILHVRVWGWKSRIGVTRPHGNGGASRSMVFLGNELPGPPLFGSAHAELNCNELQKVSFFL